MVIANAMQIGEIRMALRAYPRLGKVYGVY